MNRTLSLSLCLLLSTPACVSVTMDESALEGSGGSASGGALNGTGSASSGTGGYSATGGYTATGGLNSTGGAVATGGTTATGGAPATGGMTATGGTPATGGMTATGGSDPSGCENHTPNTWSAEFNTVDAKCFIVDTSNPLYGWQVENLGDRSITVNGAPASPPSVDFAGGSPYLIEFSAGSSSNTKFTIW